MSFTLFGPNGPNGPNGHAEKALHSLVSFKHYVTFLCIPENHKQALHAEATHPAKAELAGAS